MMGVSLYNRKYNSASGICICLELTVYQSLSQKPVENKLSEQLHLCFIKCSIYTAEFPYQNTSLGTSD